MQNKYSSDLRKILIKNATDVYNSFILLDIVDNYYYVTISKHKDSFKIDDKIISFKEFITNLKLHEKVDHAFFLECKIGISNVSLNFKKDGDAWVIHCASSNILDESYPLKDIGSITGEDFLYLLKKNPLRITFDQKENQAIAISTNIDGNNNLEIGGIGKINLYQIHLQNLYSIIQQLQEPQNDPNVLIAMVTGSGKSFTQALHYLIMNMSGIKYISSVPSKALAEQLLTDFQRILPNTLMSEMRLGVNKDVPLVQSMIVTHEYLLSFKWEQIKFDNTYTIAIDEQHEAAKEELYKRRMEALANTNPVMLLSATPTLAAYKLCNEKVLNLSKVDKEKLGIAQSAQSTVATAKSRVDKGLATLGIFSFFESFKKWFIDSIEKERVSAAFEYVDQTETTLSFRDKNDLLYMPVKSKSLEDAIEYLRYNMLSPLGQKALIFVDDHDELINLHLALNFDCGELAYSDGNKVNRLMLYSFFFHAKSNQDTDNKYSKKYREFKNESRENIIRHHLQLQGFDNDTITKALKHISLYNTLTEINELARSDLLKYFSPDKCLETVSQYLKSPQIFQSCRSGNKIAEICIDILQEFKRNNALDNNLLKMIELEFKKMNENKTLEKFLQDKIDKALKNLIPNRKIYKVLDYMDARIINGMVNYFLQKLSGYDQVRLDNERYNNPQKLIKIIHDKIISFKNKEEFNKCFNKIKAELNSNLNSAIASEVEEVLTSITSFALQNQAEERFIEKLVINWEFDKSPIFLEESLYQALYNSKSVRKFCNTYRTIFYVKGLENTPTKVPPRPFIRLNEKNYKIRENNPPNINKDDYTHTLSIIERLNIYASQYYYVPSNEQPDLDEKSADFLFKMGFVGAYITNQKVSGFNDPNLNHVGYIINKSSFELNNPAQIIQGSGRNRGLNPHKKPFFFLSNMKDVAVSFAVDTLNLQNYLPYYFKSQEKYQQIVRKRIAQTIFDELNKFLDVNITSDGKLNKEKLDDFMSEILIRELEHLYNINDHNFPKTRDELQILLKELTHALRTTERDMEKRGESSYLVKILQMIVTAIYKFAYHLTTRNSFNEIKSIFVTTRANQKNESVVSKESTYLCIVNSFDLNSIRIKKNAAIALAYGVISRSERFMANLLDANFLTNGFKNEVNLNFKICLMAWVRTIENEELRQDLENEISAVDDWSNLLMSSKKVPSDEDINQHMEAIIKKNPNINLILEKHSKPTYMNIEDAVQHIQNTLTNTVKKVQQNPIQAFSNAMEISNYLTAELNKLKDLLLSPEALKYLKSKDVSLKFDILDLPDPNLDFEENILRLIPKEYRQEFRDEGYNKNFLEQAKEAKNTLIHLCDIKTIKDKGFDKPKLIPLISGTYMPLITSKLYQDTFFSILKKLSDGDLTNIIDSAYANENVASPTSQKILALRQYMKDVETLSTLCSNPKADFVNEFFNKYILNNLDEPLLWEINEYLYKIIDEISKTQHYFHRVDEKGEIKDKDPENMSALNKDFSVMRLLSSIDTARLCNIASFAAPSEIFSANATVASISVINKVNVLLARHKLDKMQEICDGYIASLENGILGQSGDNSAAYALGKAIKDAESLSDDEVQNAYTLHISGVKKLKAEYMDKF